MEIFLHSLANDRLMVDRTYWLLLPLQQLTVSCLSAAVAAAAADLGSAGTRRIRRFKTLPRLLLSLYFSSQTESEEQRQGRQVGGSSGLDQEEVRMGSSYQPQVTETGLIRVSERMNECVTCREEQTLTRLHILEELVNLEGELGGEG